MGNKPSGKQVRGPRGRFDDGKPGSVPELSKDQAWNASPSKDGDDDIKRPRKSTSDSIKEVIGKGVITNNYIIKEDVVLGRGHYATVNAAIHKQTGKEVAVKRIQISRSRVEALRAEIEILTRVGFQANIVELYDIYVTDTEVQLVMELLRGGELFDRMVEKGPYSELEASAHIGNIVRALKYLHGRGIVHRDLKPENLLLVDKSDNSVLKIADFGLSKIVEDVENSMMQTICGTWAYAAPEVKTASGASGKVAYSYKVDLWSVGVILFVMLSAYHPFDPEGECTDAQLWANICAGKYDFNDPAWDGISESAKDLIRHLIVVDPEKRYGCDEVLQHPWIARVGASVPQTPISPGINSNLRMFQKSKKYHGASGYAGRKAPGKGMVALTHADSEDEDV